MLTNNYSINKTLRFALTPIGKTQDNITKNKICLTDAKLALEYKDAKKICDLYHKDYISRRSEVLYQSIAIDDIKDYQKILENKKLSKEKLDNIQKKLRKIVASHFTNTEEFKTIFKKEFIKKRLPDWIRQNPHCRPQCHKIIEQFNNRTSYFTNYNIARKNIYTHDDIHTSIAHRIVHTNIPLHFQNIQKFIFINKNFPEIFNIYKDDFNIIESHTSIILKTFCTIDFVNNIYTQKDIDKYNIMVGGITKGKTKIKGINEIINLFSQKSKIKIPKMNKLKKQILMDSANITEPTQAIKTDEEMIQHINDYIDSITTANYELNGATIISSMKKLFKGFNNFDLSKIYIKKKDLSEISQTIFSNYEVITNSLEIYLNKEIKDSRISILTIDTALNATGETTTITNYIKNCERNKHGGKINIFSDIDTKILNIKKILNEKYKKTEKTSITIKECMDSILYINNFLKKFLIDDFISSDEIEEDFYGILEIVAPKLNGIINLLNNVRNHITKKTNKTEKYKLNFDNPNLLAGFDANKETDNTAIILRKDDKYYLGIMHKNHKTIFKKMPKEAEKKGYEKMNYKLLPNVHMHLPKAFFSEKNINFYEPDLEILRIRNHSSHTQGGTPQAKFAKHEFNLKDCHNIIDFFKKSIKKHPDWKHFNFRFSDTKTYNNINEFYEEVKNQGYKITYSDISEEYINTCINEGKLYLFQIYNKDFSDNKKSAGTDNLHTIYWKALFDENNLQDVVYKLSGGAEVFFRKASIKYNNEIWEKGHHYNDDKKLKDKFNYPIIKDRRYAQDTYLFHVPIKINLKEKSEIKGFNNKIKTYLKDNPDVNILSIDRGERHLAYYTLLNQKGEIKKQGSFNTTTYHIKGEKEARHVDYRQKLHEREIERTNERKTWQKINDIKKLKEGYLSQIVDSIATMMVQHNAIVVFEDLNFGFKRGRFKFEKQIYQKLEKMLITKLNYYVNKNKSAGELGGLYCGYQMTAPFESFEKLGKQTGFIFYVPAYHTSQICPTTGFVNLLYPRYQNITKAKEFFGTFDNIQFNQKEHMFEFHLHYSKFAEKKFIKNIEGGKDQWTIYTNGTRLTQHKINNKWITKEVNLTDNIITLLKSKNIQYKNNENIIKEITNINEKDFFYEFFYILKITLQIRNYEINSDNDYILSCVKDEHGHFFDSRAGDITMPVNSDANGAYHIGLKGLLLLQKILKNNKNLTISNAEWYNARQFKDCT